MIHLEDHQVKKNLPVGSLKKRNIKKAAAPLAPSHNKPKKVKKRNLEKSFVGTLDRYQYKNEDGSITWGYQNEDGGFKVGFLSHVLIFYYFVLQEETIGMDCITQREYGYTSGVRCDPHTRKVRHSSS